MEAALLARVTKRIRKATGKRPRSCHVTALIRHYWVSTSTIASEHENNAGRDSFAVTEDRFFWFELLHKSRKAGSQARVGRIHTPHGIIDTPGYVPVATNAALKGLDHHLADEDASLQLMFCNTYHLLIHPGPDIVARAGGLHKFMNRQKPLITDSGGFQVFSLAYGTVFEEINQVDASSIKSKEGGRARQHNTVLKITEEGVLFKSYRDGSRLLLTPESTVQAQKKLGADIIIPLDELPPYHIESNTLESSLERTHRWEERSLNEHLRDRRQQAMYAVVHGGIDKQLRQRSAEHLRSLPFDGFAVGGSVGKNHDEMVEMLSHVMPLLPEDKPNHLLGVADYKSLSKCVPLGIDTFDSCYPTRLARHGTLLTNNGTCKIYLARKKWEDVHAPIDEDCDCYTCKRYTLSYLHHLYKMHEGLAVTLASAHNLYQMSKLMANFRAMIYDDLI